MHPLSIEPNDDDVCDMWWGEEEHDPNHVPNCPTCHDNDDMERDDETNKWTCVYWKCKEDYQ